ncbi:MAG TPA: carbonic anhydrase [Xanthobacteraceae bacterium]|nr:carbonic anhydrase [Xanthobacteraceae bacterium]
MGRTLELLLARNQQWARRKTANDPAFFQRTAAQQRPNYLWIGCSDSRIAANDVLELDPGQVFVHRNIANVVHTSDLNILSVLEFAVDHLKVQHIIVCGNYGCGGIERVFAPERGELFDHWLQPVSMFYRKHRKVFNALAPQERLQRMCEVNIEMQVRRLAATPIVENAWARGQELHLHGWIYRIGNGLLHDLGPHLSSIAERDALPSIDDCVSKA